jgi:hypothetical protein
MNLIEERPIAFTNDRKHLPQATCRLKRPLMNDKSHE